jgi:hypothetical protein
MVVGEQDRMQYCGSYYFFYDHHTLSHHYHKLSHSLSHHAHTMLTSLSHYGSEHLFSFSAILNGHGSARLTMTE